MSKLLSSIGVPSSPCLNAAIAYMHSVLLNTSIKNGANNTAPPIPAIMAMVAIPVPTKNINQRLGSITITSPEAIRVKAQSNLG